MVSSTVVPQVQAVFPQGALTKKIKVGLQVKNRKDLKEISVVKPRKNGLLRRIIVNNIPKKKRYSLFW